ncbi:hypothetical protein AVEN_51094-1 [Araneus ventricosus]|uniref:Uncharacterized protein n=1 Tax=Araneus ventricosus TaxID=182803 RepID=A0A4Y2QB26_ARAVE|nr:hypothetical protein AVEN_51094-1 [Araneus ventricosus]
MKSGCPLTRTVATAAVLVVATAVLVADKTYLVASAAVLVASAAVLVAAAAVLVAATAVLVASTAVSEKELQKFMIPTGTNVLKKTFQKSADVRQALDILKRSVLHRSANFFKKIRVRTTYK